MSTDIKELDNVNYELFAFKKSPYTHLDSLECKPWILTRIANIGQLVLSHLLPTL